MFMSNSIFVDSSLLVEYIKGSQTEFLDALRNEPDARLFISQTVVSEYLFYHLAELGQKSPRTLKENRRIPGILSAVNPVPFLEQFLWLPDEASMLQPTVDFMSKYNLLPNDALILAACKLHGIKALASFDPDFNAPCQGEGIRLLRTSDDFEVFKQSLL